MSLDTYANLKTAVQDWIIRNGDTDFTNAADDILDLAEARIHYGAMGPFASDPLRVRAMEAQTILKTGAAQSGGTSGGSANAQTVTLGTAPTLALGLTISFTAGFSNSGAMTLNANATGAVDVRKNSARDPLASGDVLSGAPHTVYHDGTYYVLVPGPGYIPLPTDFLAMRSIYIDGSPDTPLTQMSSYALTAFDDDNADKPSEYALDGDLLRLSPAPDDTYYLKTTYWKKFPALSGSQTTNWLLTNAPSIYLYGCLLEGSIYVKNFQEAQSYHGLFMSAIGGLMRSNKMDRYSGAPLRMRVGGMIA